MKANALVLVSACLLGLRCRYDGQGREYPLALELLRLGRALPFCPEQAGGLATPRPPAEIRGDRVVTCRGQDVTEPFLRGAQEALGLCRRASLTQALLRDRSPSCGCRWIYDGSFSGRLVAGRGLTARLLAAEGLELFSDQEDLTALWRSLEEGP